jgi:hypothetical protein
LYERKEKVSLIQRTTTRKTDLDFENKVDLVEKDPHLFQSKYIEDKLKEARERQREEVKRQKNKYLNEMTFLFRMRDH